MLVLGDEQHLIDIDVTAGQRNQRSRQQQQHCGLE
jgi:hypothetical protein